VVDVAFAIPGDIATPTGGYAYDREVLARLPEHGIRARHLPLPAGYPDPTPHELAETTRLFAGLSPDTVLIIDGLAFGAMPAEAIAGTRQRIIALVHHPLGYEPGLSEERARQLVELERKALTFARAVLVTSPFTKRLLVDKFAVPERKITIAQPGTEPAERAHGTGEPLQLLSVGSVTPRKAFPTLVTALAPLAGLDWRLTIAGPLDRDPIAVAELKSAIARLGLEDRIGLRGSRCLRAAEPVRRVRHGFDGGDGTRPADRLHHRGRCGRDRARWRGHQGAAGCRGPIDGGLTTGDR
jgi:glycosyltransferase involved in cell wall biosynthesis